MSSLSLSFLSGVQCPLNTWSSLCVKKCLKQKKEKETDVKYSPRIKFLFLSHHWVWHKAAAVPILFQKQIPSPLLQPLCWQSSLCKDNGTDDFPWAVKIIKVMTTYWQNYGINCCLLICFHLGSSLWNRRILVTLLPF